MGLWITLAVIAVILLWIVITFNRLVGLRNEGKQGFSGIEVQLKRRADLIPNLVEIVKGYAAHEQSVFENVTRARSATLSASDQSRVAEADGHMRTAIGGLMAVAEAYPDLQANQNFLHLHEELVDTEDKIAAARRYYNSVVRRLNTKVESFPDMVIARSFGFAALEYYRVSDDNDRSPVPVSFSRPTDSGAGS